MNIAEKLMEIQGKLKAPKNQKNSFGNYNYRSCEDILEAVKPLLAEFKCTMTLNDEMVIVGDRIYVKATATLKSVEEPGDCVVNCAFAREAESKKGMDESQVTGATSSYARKYALNGLFLIDDNKDADTDEYNTITNQKSEAKPKTAPKAVSKTEEKTGEKPKVSEETKKIRRNFVSFCEQHKDIVNWKDYKLTENSSDQDFINALADAKAKVANATTDGELPFPLD